MSRNNTPAAELASAVQYPENANMFLTIIRKGPERGHSKLTVTSPDTGEEHAQAAALAYAFRTFGMPVDPDGALVWMLRRYSGSREGCPFSEWLEGLRKFIDLDEVAVVGSDGIRKAGYAVGELLPDGR